MTEQKIEAFWRDANAEDIAKVMRGEKVEARFRDSDKEGWICGFVKGWAYEKYRGNDGWAWDQCQVYEPQQWWLDKPDPGEGYRLLEKFPAEELQPEDDWWKIESKEWLPSRRACRGEQQDEDVWYRRRIEPVKQDAGSTCASSIPKGWTALSDNEPRLASDAFWSVGAKDWVIIDECRVEYANRDKWPAIRQVDPVKQDAGSTCASNIPKGWAALSLDEPRLASDAYWSQDAEAWIIVDGWVEAANRQKWPAIRQVESWRCMQLMEGCFYRLPNGQGIEITKEGFELG